MGKHCLTGIVHRWCVIQVTLSRSLESASKRQEDSFLGAVEKDIRKYSADLGRKANWLA